MATLKDVKDKVAQIKEDVLTEMAEVKASVDALNKQIVDLKTQLANGNLVSQADLDELSAGLAEIDQGVKDIITPPVEPTP